ncbi:MAG: transposase [Deltaproteobacteria bacterium]|nr:transposase [Deltaproteobacteria bacterium]
MTFLETDINELVSANHPYRKILELVDFRELTKELRKCYSKMGRGGYPVESGFKALLLQYMEDLSNREAQRFLEENLSGKLFCGFNLREQTPEHTYFVDLRQRIGTKRLAELFNRVREALIRNGMIREVFTFVDATKLISKMSTWDERDKAIKAGEEKFNNAVAEKYARDKEARFGCKGKDKFWFGHKKNISVDMTNGLINKVAVTPANVPDHKGLKHICPRQGAVFGDKVFSPKYSRDEIKRRGCHSGVILKNNMKEKDRDKDRWLTKVRMPYEGTFARMRKRTWYSGVAKNQLEAFLEALVFNFKRLIKIEAPPLQFTS